MSLKRKQTISKEEFMWESRDGLMRFVGCSSKSGKHKGLGFFRIPKITTNQGEEPEELTTKRRNEWISAVSHGDATNKRVNEFVANTSSSESQH